MTRPILYAFVALQLSVAAAAAHPVAQGAMEILIGNDAITIRARVSTEQAYVAEAFSTGKKAANLDEVWQRHGDYLVNHLHLTADGVALTAGIGKITPPEHPSQQQVTYDLSFPLPPGRERPRSLVLTQDVLNEFSFAPGNRWEATYVVRVTQQNAIVKEDILFTSREPLVIACDSSSTPR